MAASDETLPDALQNVAHGLGEIWRKHRLIGSPGTGDLPSQATRASSPEISRMLLTTIEFVLHIVHPAVGVALAIVDHGVQAWEGLNSPDGVALAVPLPVSLGLVGASVGITLTDDTTTGPGWPLRFGASLPDGLNGAWDITISSGNAATDEPDGHPGEETPIRPLWRGSDARSGEPGEPHLSCLAIRFPELDDKDGKAFVIATIYATGNGVILALTSTRVKERDRLCTRMYLIAGDPRRAPTVRSRRRADKQCGDDDAFVLPNRSSFDTVSLRSLARPTSDVPEHRPWARAACAAEST